MTWKTRLYHNYCQHCRRTLYNFPFVGDKFETGQNELEEDGINYDSSLDRNKWSGLAAEEPNVSDEILEKALEAINREKQKAYSEGGPMFISNKKDGTYLSCWSLMY